MLIKKILRQILWLCLVPFSISAYQPLNKQTETHNLPTQTRKVEDRCKRDGLTVLKKFVDAESARTDERTQFQEMLKYCRTHRGKVTHVVFADLSRLTKH